MKIMQHNVLIVKVLQAFSHDRQIASSLLGRVEVKTINFNHKTDWGLAEGCEFNCLITNIVVFSSANASL